jgi:hypothetical protein
LASTGTPPFYAADDTQTSSLGNFCPVYG